MLYSCTHTATVGVKGLSTDHGVIRTTMETTARHNMTQSVGEQVMQFGTLNREWCIVNEKDRVSH